MSKYASKVITVSNLDEYTNVCSWIGLDPTIGINDIKANNRWASYLIAIDPQLDQLSPLTHSVYVGSNDAKWTLRKRAFLTYHQVVEDFSSKPKSTSTLVNPAEVLKAGAKHMEDRAATYDNPQGERSMGKTVGAFNVITGKTLTEEEGWLFMEILKQVRSMQGNFKLDNYEDEAAYVALRAEAASRDRG